MPIPALNRHGLLPKGIHDCTLAEIGIIFSLTDRRSKRAVLFKNLESFVAWIKPMGHFSFIYIDGSFVTNKQVPGDIDLVLELPASTPNIGNIILKSKVFNGPYVKSTFGLHLYPHVPGMSSKDFTSFFQYLRPDEAITRGLQAGETKGILRVAI